MALVASTPLDGNYVQTSQPPSGRNEQLYTHSLCIAVVSEPNRCYNRKGKYRIVCLITYCFLREMLDSNKTLELKGETRI